jgi:predicted ester cyclase
MKNRTTEQLNIVVNFFQELWNERKLNIADNIFSTDFITESIGLEPSNWESTHGKGPNSMRHHIEWWLTIIPDAKMEVIDIVGSGDKVITNWKLTGTIKGVIFGVEPTNREVFIFGCTVSIFQDNKIALNKTLFDKLGFYQQINVLPPTSEIFKK